MRDINKDANIYDSDGTLRKHRLNVAYVDIYTDDGELIKHTFDLTAIPFVVFVRDGKFYTLNKSILDNLYSAASLDLILDFVKSGHLQTPYDLLNSRTTKQLILYDYMLVYFAE